MTGRIVRHGHACPTPAAKHVRGTVWQCDCGRYWAMTDRWVGVSSLEVSMLRIGDAWAAAQKATAERAAAERAAAAVEAEAREPRNSA